METLSGDPIWEDGMRSRRQSRYPVRVHTSERPCVASPQWVCLLMHPRGFGRVWEVREGRTSLNRGVGIFDVKGSVSFVSKFALLPSGVQLTKQNRHKTFDIINISSVCSPKKWMWLRDVGVRHCVPRCRGCRKGQKSHTFVAAAAAAREINATTSVGRSVTPAGCLAAWLVGWLAAT